MSGPPRQSPQPPRRVQRLDSLKSPQGWAAPPTPTKQRPQKCINPECGDPHNLIDEDHKIICTTCGTVAQDSPPLVTDLNFGLTEGGRAVLHGHHVGADSAYASGGDNFGHHGQSSHARTISAGKEAIRLCVNGLSMNPTLQKTAEHFFSLACQNNFNQGRRIKAVGAVCLYLACRVKMRHDDAPYANRFMLIDFADVLGLDVFQLGKVYQDSIDVLSLNTIGYEVQPINPEDLILRFAKNLEFGNDAGIVANDAVRLVQRMKRDYMSVGRRPAGICSAAMIIAARMHNFRRTPRELSLLSKLNENTIVKRLEEFRDTPSANLTVEVFRELYNRGDEDDPPSFKRNRQGQKKGRKRKRKHLEFDDDGDDLGHQPTPVESRTASPGSTVVPDHAIIPEESSGRQPATPSPSRRPTSHSREMPPPPLPVDPALQAERSTRSGKAKAQSAETRTHAGRGSSNTNLSASVEASIRADTTSPSRLPSANDPLPNDPLLIPSSSQILEAQAANPPPRRRKGRPKGNARSETEVSDPEITAAMADPFAAGLSALQATADIVANAEAELSATAQARGGSISPTARRGVPMTESIAEDEFADDPEVQNCLLGEEEREIKTRIWMSVNAEWIREQASKKYKYELEVANGTHRPVKHRVRRRRRIGDLTIYAEQMGKDWQKRLENGEGVANSAASAVEMMMQKRGYGRGKALSSKINYEKMRELYTPSTSASRAASVAGESPRSGAQLPPPTASDGAATAGEEMAIDPALEGETKPVQTEKGKEAAERGAAADNMVERGTQEQQPIPTEDEDGDEDEDAEESAEDVTAGRDSWKTGMVEEDNDLGDPFDVGGEYD